MSASDLDRLFCGRGDARLPHDQTATAKTASVTSGWAFIGNRASLACSKYLPSLAFGSLQLAGITRLRNTSGPIQASQVPISCVTGNGPIARDFRALTGLV